MEIASEKRPPVELIVAALVQIFPRVLGVMLLYTGYQKYHDHTALLAILEWDGFPVSIVPTLGWTVIWTEILLGAALILLPPARWLLGITAGVFLVFIGQLIVLVFSKNAPNYCGCELLKTVLAVQAGHRHEQRNMLMLDTVLLVAIGLTWLQLKTPPRPEPSGFEVLPKETP